MAEQGPRKETGQPCADTQGSEGKRKKNPQGKNPSPVSKKQGGRRESPGKNQKTDPRTKHPEPPVRAPTPSKPVRCGLERDGDREEREKKQHTRSGGAQISPTRPRMQRA